MKNREQLEKAHQEFRSSLTSEADRTQEEVVNLAKKALIVGGAVLTLNVIRNAFFVKDKKGKKENKPSREATFLSKELGTLAVVELLNFAAKKLSEYLEKQEQKTDEKNRNA